jgi:hypothetical protein
MNLSGSKNYSQAVKGIRDRTVLKKDEFKLLFLFPVLADQSLINIPVNTFAEDKNSLGDLIRGFIAVSVLNEIFVSNALNLVSMASEFDPAPKRELGSKSIELIDALLRGDKQTRVNVNPEAPDYPQLNPDLLQRKITQKTAVIKQLLSTDPKLSKLNPFIEIVTLQNMIDVPVIVGTSLLPIESAGLYLFILVSALTNTKLNSVANITKIANTLRQVNLRKGVMDIYRVIDNAKILTDKKDKPSVFTNISDKIKGLLNLPTSKIYTTVSNLPGISNIVKRREGQTADQVEKLQSQSEIDSRALSNLAAFQEDIISKTEAFFKLNINDDILYRRLGLSKEAGQSRSVVKRTNEKMDVFLNKIQNSFHDFISGQGTLLLHSVHNILYPDGIGRTQYGSRFNFFEIKRELFDNELSKEFIDFNEYIRDSLEKTIENINPGSGDSQIKVFSELCKLTKQDGVVAVHDLTTTMSDSAVQSINFTDIEFTDFVFQTEKAVAKAASLSKKMESMLLRVLVDGVTMLPKLRLIISNTVDIFLKQYSEFGAPGSDTPSQLSHIVGSAFTPQYYQNSLQKLKTFIVEYFYFMFLFIFQLHLCDYIEFIDVEIDISQNDVLDLPNYTLVLPMDLIVALHRAIMGRTWKNVVNDDVQRGLFGSPSENNLKKVIKIISNRLDVPNLFVVDTNKGDVFYKFQYKSDVVKTKIKTLDTYVATNIKRKELEATNSMYY